MNNQPPTDIAAHVLFRSLLQTPRPIQPLHYKVMGIELSARAISFADVADSIEQGSKAIDYHVLYQSVVLRNGKQAFSSPSAVQALSPVEFNKLRQEVIGVLTRISPMVNLSDAKSWADKLESGARHSSNYIITHSLGSCFDLVVLPDKVLNKDRPEDYFGIPRKELLDCHWMAYWAARKVYREQLLESKSEEQVINEAKRDLNYANTRQPIK